MAINFKKVADDLFANNEFRKRALAAYAEGKEGELGLMISERVCQKVPMEKKDEKIVRDRVVEKIIREYGPKDRLDNLGKGIKYRPMLEARTLINGLELRKADVANLAEGARLNRKRRGRR